MGGSDGTRAVSEVMGAILVFSFLITALGAYQAIVVPDVNEEVEFKHNQEVQRDFVDLRNSIHRSSTDGEDTSVSADLGVRYPTRALTLNPPPQGGTVRMQTAPDSLEIENAIVEDSETGDYWNGDTKTFTSGSVAYEPAYNRYRQAPTTRIENGIVYNHFTADDQFIPLSGQRVVSGREISLLALDGDLSKSQVGEVAIDVNSVSAGSTRVPVTNSGGNLTIEVPTKLSEEVWVGTLLNGQIDNADATTTSCSDIPSPADDSDADRYIANCDYSTGPEFNTLVLFMEEDQTYTLNLAKVSVGENAPEPDAHYVVPLEGDGASVPEAGKERLVLQVRDRFDNPVSGESVNISLDPPAVGTLTVNGKSGDTFSDVKTNEEGKLYVTYDAPARITSSPIEVDVETSFASTPDGSMNSDTRQNATFDIRVINASKTDRTKPLLNPSDGIAVVGAEAPKNNSHCSDTNRCILEVEFEKLGDSGSRNITEIRYTYFSGDSQGVGGSATDTGELRWLKPNLPASKDLPLKGEYEDLGSEAIEVDSSGETVRFEVVDKEGNHIAISSGDLFVIEIIEEGEVSRTYFFSPQTPNK